MKALLLAAGLGTRLRPFTFFRAKAMLPLWNVPFLYFPLQYLAANKVEETVINLHAHPDSIRKAAGSGYGTMQIAYSYEPEILGTAGAIRKAKPLLGEEPFVVMNSDMLTAVPLQDVLDQHTRTGALVTLVVMKGFQQYSGLEFQANPLRLTGFHPQSGEKYHYTGVQIVHPELAELIPPGKKTEIFSDIYPSLIAEGKILGFLYEGYWQEIGTLRNYLKTSLELTPVTLPPSMIPEGAIPGMISSTAKIAADAVVHDSIVMDEATISAGCRIERCIIGWEAFVDKNYEDVALARGVLPWYIS